MEQDKATLPFVIIYGSILPLILIFDFFVFLGGIGFMRIIYGLFVNFGYWNFLIIPLSILSIGLMILISIRVVVGYML